VSRAGGGLMAGGPRAVAAAGHPTLTSSFRYTLSLLGAVLAVFLLRPPALRSIPCRQNAVWPVLRRQPSKASLQACRQGAPWLLFLLTIPPRVKEGGLGRRGAFGRTRFAIAETLNHDRLWRISGQFTVLGVYSKE
jgi:hypothetical protein